MDVNRCFHNHQIINHMSLHNILKIYSYQNPEVKYFQGMNFLAGYLLAILEDEKRVLQMYGEIVDRFLVEILLDDLKGLERLLYLLDEIIKIKLPALAQHMSHLGITANFYATPWFLTLFSNS